MSDSPYDVGRKDRPASDRTISNYDRTRGGLEGVAMFTKPTTIRTAQAITGKTETFLVETARHAELGDTIFVECVSDDGVVRLALPPRVANAISRQRDSLTARAKSRSARAAAKDRMDRGEIPFKKRLP